MSAESVVYYLNRVPESDPIDQTEWLVAALGRFTGAELRELLYVAEEPGFFELMRGLFALPEESRAVLQHHLETGHPPAMKAVIDPRGRLTLDHVDVGAADQDPAGDRKLGNLRAANLRPQRPEVVLVSPNSESWEPDDGR